MAKEESELMEFQPSLEAARDMALLEAQTESHGDRWRRLWRDDRKLAAQLLLIRERLEAEGVSSTEREMALATFVHSVDAISETRRQLGAQSNGQKTSTEITSQSITDDLLPTDAMRRRRLANRWRPRNLGRSATSGTINPIIS